ncbi:MAG: FAD-dependent oxidoreductase, partial [Acidobacteriota bacterium]
AVVGSGFAGSLLAMIARRQGRSVILLEKGRHPRFAIGESSTPLSNLLLEDLALRYNLPGIAPLAKWGTWMQTYPNLDCGLKRGFTFYHHEFGRHAARSPERRDQLLVAASPHDAIADTHWHRADFDQHFVHEARKTGVDYLDEVDLREAAEHDEEIRLRGQRHGKEIAIRARFVVDATGPRGFLHRALGLTELSLPDFPPTQALFTHFRGVRRLEDLLDENRAGQPYPVDDAAVHHVFEGGWIWVLRFRGGVTSAGVAAVDSLAARLRLSEGAPAWERLLRQLPTVRDQFAGTTLERPFTYAPRLAFRSGNAAGRRWALLPSAAGFVDPLLSTGFPLVLLGVTRLAGILEDHWDTAQWSDELARYARLTSGDLLATAKLIGALYASMNNFPLFVSLSLLYFATASFAETARRLGKPHLAGSFLLHEHPGFQGKLDELLTRARLPQNEASAGQLASDILHAIEPFNVAGLGNPERRNWYPVEAGDLLGAARKVEATREDVMQLLDHCGFWATIAD